MFTKSKALRVTDKKSGQAGSCWVPRAAPAIPPSPRGRSGQAARASPPEVDSEETHWAHAPSPSHRKDPRIKVATSGRGTHRGYLELVSKQRSQRRVRSGSSWARAQASAPHTAGHATWKPPWGPPGHWGVQFTLQKQPQLTAPESLGETPRPCLLWACRGMGRLGGWSPLGALDAAGACLVHSRAGGWAPHPCRVGATRP